MPVYCLPIAVIPGASIDRDNPSSVPVVVAAIVISIVMASVVITVIPSMVVVSRRRHRHKTGRANEDGKQW